MTARYDALSRYELSETGQAANRKIVNTRRQYTLYTVRDGDTLESLASRHLGDPRRHWEISDINPQVKFPTDLDVGTTIRLPL